MIWFWMAVKALVMAVFILALTEIAKRNAYVSAVIIAFPIMTVLTIGNLYLETGNRLPGQQAGLHDILADCCQPCLLSSCCIWRRSSGRASGCRSVWPLSLQSDRS